MRKNVQKIIVKICVVVIIALLLFGSGYYFGRRDYRELSGEYSAYRERAERELEQLRGALTDAQVRSDTAIRGLDEAIRGVRTITDRNKRIEYLTEAIRATVVQLRAIYDRTGQGISKNGEGTQYLENSDNR
jgi:hypothetical protein